MALILNTKYKKNYSFFLYNRFLRLYPVYGIVLLCTVLIIITLEIYAQQPVSYFKIQLFFNEHNGMFTISTKLLTILSNIAILGQDLFCFLKINNEGSLLFSSNTGINTVPAHLFLVVPQAWSISLELFFYITAPFIVKRKTWVVFLSCAITFLIRYLMLRHYHLAPEPWAYKFFPFELPLFLSGALAYKSYAFIKKKQLFSKKICLTVFFLFIAYVVLYQFCFDFYLYKRLDYLIFSKIYLHIIYFAMPVVLPFIFYLTKSIKWDRYIGDLSYPIYISHWLILIIFRKSFTSITGQKYIIITMIFIIIAAICLTYFVEMPIHKYRQRMLSLKHK